MMRSAVARRSGAVGGGDVAVGAVVGKAWDPRVVVLPLPSHTVHALSIPGRFMRVSLMGSPALSLASDRTKLRDASLGE